jgi:superfamily I DNA/RNA helicase
MKTWLRSFAELSPEQKKIVQMPPRESSLVSGPPGSGKTQALVHRIAYLIKTHKASPDKIRLFVLTDVLEKMIKSEMKRLGLPQKIVALFDHWCRSFFVHHVSTDLPRIYVNGRINFEKTRFGVLEILQRKKDLRKCIEYALVDDGQDLTPEAFEILSLAAEHITVFADAQQKIHEEGASHSFVSDALNLHKKSSLLSGDFRSSFSVAQLAAHFIDDQSCRKEYLSQVRNEQKTSQSSLFYVAPSEEKELDHLSRYVLQRQAMNEKVGIFVPISGSVHRMAKALKERGIETEKAIPMDAQNVIHKPYDFGNSLPKITTYPMAKGLTFDSVLMPQLTENAFSKIPPFLRHRHLFVGITRASKWVYMSTVKGQEFGEMTRLRSAEKEGKIRILDKIPNI